MKKEIVVAGGCFWGVQEYYRWLKGVEETRVGYAQGSLENPNYTQVKRQISGHAECVRIVYDSDQITLEQLFDHLFRIIDPTSLNRQGNDVGASYRTGIYPACAEDEVIARQFLAGRQKDYDHPIVTEVERLVCFYDAEQEHQDYLTSEIQRLMTLLNMKTGIYNIETCVANGKPYIMEVSPRGGGCKIAELQRMAYGVDLIEAEVKKAVGMPIDEIKQTECDGCWCEMVVHARPGKSGILRSVTVDSDIKEKYLKVVDLSAKPGDFVQPFTGANMSLGDMFFRFDDRTELETVMSKSNEWLHIELDEK